MRSGIRSYPPLTFTALLIGGILLRVQYLTVFGTVLVAVAALPLVYAVFADAFARRGPLQ